MRIALLVSIVALAVAVAVAVAVASLGGVAAAAPCPEVREDYTRRRGPSRPLLYAVDVPRGADLVVRDPRSLRPIAFTAREVDRDGHVVLLAVEEDGDVEVLVDGALQIRYFGGLSAASRRAAEISRGDGGDGWIDLDVLSDAVALRWDWRPSAGGAGRRWYSNASVPHDLRLGCGADARSFGREPGTIEVTALFPDGMERTFAQVATPLVSSSRPVAVEGALQETPPIGDVEHPEPAPAPRAPDRPWLALAIAAATLLSSRRLARRVGGPSAAP